MKIWTTNGFTAIDIDGRVIRVAQAVRRGHKTTVTRLVAEPLPENGSRLNLEDPEAVGRWLAEALRRMHIQPRPIVLGMPRRKAVLKPLTLPVIDDPDELAAVVRLQVKSELPFSSEEAVIDFAVQSVAKTDGEAGAASGSADGTMHVLVAAVKQSDVEYYRRLSSAAGFRLGALGLRSHANATCLQFCEVAGLQDRVALVYLRPDEAIIDVIVGHSLAFSRALPFPLSSLSDAEDTDNSHHPKNDGNGITDLSASEKAKSAIKDVSVEVVRSIQGYEMTEGERPVSRVLVAGVTGLEREVQASLSSSLKIPCEVFDPTSRLKLEGHNVKLVPAAITAIGLTVGANQRQGMPFDFVNPKRAAVKRDPRFRRALLVAASVLALLTCGAVIRSRITGATFNEISQLEERIAGLKANVRSFKTRIVHERSVLGWRDTGRHWLKHWAYLSAVLPPCEKIYVTGLTTSAAGVVRVTIQARNGDVLADVDRRLRAAGYSVHPMAVTPVNDTFGYSVKTTVKIGIPKGLTIDLETARPSERPDDDESLDTGSRDTTALTPSRATPTSAESSASRKAFFVAPAVAEAQR